VLGDHPVDHLPDRLGLAGVAPDVAGLEPVEAGLRIVGGLLFGIEQHEAVLIGERRPASAVVVAGRRLRAAVQNDHEGRGRPYGFRGVLVHAQIAGVRAEARYWLKAARDRRRSPGVCRLCCAVQCPRPVAAQARQIRDRGSKAGHLNAPNGFLV
jgi:hypothetical protein